MQLTGQRWREFILRMANMPGGIEALVKMDRRARDLENERRRDRRRELKARQPHDHVIVSAELVQFSPALLRRMAEKKTGKRQTRRGAKKGAAHVA